MEFEFQSLNPMQLQLTAEGNKKFNLDFDDAFQYGVAKENGLTIVTLDSDFKKVKDIKIIFL